VAGLGPRCQGTVQLATACPLTEYNPWVKYEGSMLADPLSATLAAIADPTRRAILARLAKGDASVTELAEPFAMSMPAITKHLKVLERAGLLTRTRHAQWRPCQLRAEGLRVAADWIDRYRTLWEERFDRMEAYLEELQRAEQSVAPAAKPNVKKAPRDRRSR
jgi:DNA-binding transcriptional ArsR family regulator